MTKTLSLLALWAAFYIFSAATLVSEESSEDSLADHKAKVFALSGPVEVLKSGTQNWVPLQINDVIEEGDKVRTGDNAYAEIVYDDYFLNYVRLDENSDMNFESIETTDVYLSVGKLFNNLSGLVEDSEYTVSTPTSVAAVRGTSFVREYDPENLSDETSVSDGTVDVTPLRDGKPDPSQAFKVKQNQHLQFDRDMIQHKDFRKALPGSIPKDKMKKLQDMRDQSKGRLQQFAGGKDKFNRARKDFKQLKKNPGKLKDIKQRQQRPDQRKVMDKQKKDPQKRDPQKKQIMKENRVNHKGQNKNPKQPLKPVNPAKLERKAKPQLRHQAPA
ncbi:FecR domain-containing protein [Omnitrophica bacterium]|nr:FecR domain-containing protein [Candidatus Omnitrophota bacterium]